MIRTVPREKVRHSVCRNARRTPGRRRAHASVRKPGVYERSASACKIQRFAALRKLGPEATTPRKGVERGGEAALNSHSTCISRVVQPAPPGATSMCNRDCTQADTKHHQRARLGNRGGSRRVTEIDCDEKRP